jgi:heme/copper-type cytochrome/quinol oxidase subunit 3
MTDIAAVAPEPTRATASPKMGVRPLGWWGMIFVIATEGTIFALLLFAYFYIRANTHPWPPHGIEDPELFRSGIRSILLIGSSLPAALGERAMKRGEMRKFRVYLGITFTLASIFLAGHIVEWLDLSKKFTPTTNVYGSLVYTITGLHIIHVVVGMMILAFLFIQSLRGRYAPGKPHTGASCGILYWHFVDAVWLAVFSSLYLSVTW